MLKKQNPDSAGWSYGLETDFCEHDSEIRVSQKYSFAARVLVVDSASNRNEYQESSRGGGKGRPARKADKPHSCL
jgi:hypothetical protein